ncbi:hypothetical protein L345_14822, partial [Ophiophagus hannah]
MQNSPISRGGIQPVWSILSKLDLAPPITSQESPRGLSGSQVSQKWGTWGVRCAPRALKKEGGKGERKEGRERKKKRQRKRK